MLYDFCLHIFLFYLITLTLIYAIYLLYFLLNFPKLKISADDEEMNSGTSNTVSSSSDTVKNTETISLPLSPPTIKSEESEPHGNRDISVVMSETHTGSSDSEKMEIVDEISHHDENDGNNEISAHENEEREEEVSGEKMDGAVKRRQRRESEEGGEGMEMDIEGDGEEGEEMEEGEGEEGEYKEGGDEEEGDEEGEGEGEYEGGREEETQVEEEKKKEEKEARNEEKVEKLEVKREETLLAGDNKDGVKNVRNEVEKEAEKKEEKGVEKEVQQIPLPSVVTQAPSITEFTPNPLKSPDQNAEKTVLDGSESGIKTSSENQDKSETIENEDKMEIEEKEFEKIDSEKPI